MNFQEALQNVGRTRFFYPGHKGLFPIINIITDNGKHIRFSMQASDTHYCSPRENLPSLMNYTELEIAFMAPRDKRMKGLTRLNSEAMFIDPAKYGFEHVELAYGDEVCAYQPTVRVIQDFSNLVSEVRVATEADLAKKLSRSHKSNRSLKNAIKAAKKAGVNFWLEG